jgi:predicted transcriptional regulator
MSEKRNREHVVSVRVDPDELARLQQLASDRGTTISTVLREIALADVLAATNPCAAQVLSQSETRVWAQAARLITVYPTKWYGGKVTVSAQAARELATALLVAAEIAERSNAEDEAWETAHGAVS